MALNAVHDSLDDIPEPFRELYTEKNGKFELTGIQGVKTQADVDRLNDAIRKERETTASVKDKLKVWEGFEYDDVVQKLDKLPELEAAAKGKLDEAEIESIVSRRVEGTIKSKTSPLERKLQQLEREREELFEQNQKFAAAERTRKIHDHVRKALSEAKVLNEAQEDALLLADRVFEIAEDGSVLTRDQVGVTPGLDPGAWLTEMQPRRPHWWPATQGGGARGTNSLGIAGGTNPWTAETWNLTEQGRILREHGTERAEQLAKLAGTTVGGRKPAPKR